MDENRVGIKEEMEIDTQRLIGAVWNKAWLVALVAVVCALLSFLGTFYFVTPQYRSSAMFYVNTNAVSVSDASISIDSGDISAAKSLVDSYIVILQTRESLDDVIEYAGVDRTVTELRNMISAASVNSTEIFEIVVTSPDPYEAEKIANSIAHVLPERIAGIIEGTSAKVVDTAVVASSPSSPSHLLNTLVGFVVGFALSVGIILLAEFFNITVRTEEDVTRGYKPPILASVPDMTAPSKGSYYQGSGKRKGPRKIGVQDKQSGLVGAEVSFAAMEAYKLLRTKLQFSFSSDSASRVIGISSALAGEGKSLSTVNLAYALAQLDKRVLLIDCDMRRPSISAKLPVTKTPGLSNYLSGQVSLDVLFQGCGIQGEEDAFKVIAAGRNPPNPVELLSSVKMSRMLGVLRERYDYILLDLPPIGEVSDALAVAKEADGILMVVRQNYCDRISYGAAIRQLEFVGARVLGVVYNCATEHGGGYGKKYYRKYGGAKYAYAGARKAPPARRNAGEEP